MTCLVYGIVFSRSRDRGSGHPPPGLPPGVGGAPVRLIEEGGLGAAVSWILIERGGAASHPPEPPPPLRRSESGSAAVAIEIERGGAASHPDSALSRQGADGSGRAETIRVAYQTDGTRSRARPQSRGKNLAAGLRSHPPGPPTPLRRSESGSAASLPLELTPNIARVLSYAKVVEALHADRAVLPMRYGCRFEEEPQVVELLRLHGEEYATLLRGLDGCVEMGVRVLLPTKPSFPCPPFGPEIEGASGRAYLAAGAARYAREEETDRALAAVVERLRAALDGLAERSETDRGVRADRRLSSLYFLVKRGAVESFRRAFQRIERAEAARLLLSGPWPPYNFAAPERPGHGHG